MTISELSRRSGVARTTLNVIYHGKGKGIFFETADKICLTLGCSLGELFEHIPDDLD